MTPRNPLRRDYDAANLRRRAEHARQYLEVWRYGERLLGPYLQDVTGMSPVDITREMNAIESTGGTATLKQGTPPDEGRR